MPPKKKVAAAGGKTAVGGTAKKKKAATKKKKKAEPSAPPPPPPLPDDPWLVYKSRHGGKMSAADEWLKVISEKLDELLASLPSQTPSMVSESARAERLDKLQGKSAGTDTEPEPELEPKPVSVLSCCSADVASFKLSEALRATLVSLDLTDNSLKCTSPAVTATSQSAPALLSPPVNTLTLPSGGCWLRSLCLRANELVCLPPLASMPKLLHLDLSYNPQLQHVLSLDEQPIREAFAAVPLRSIMLEGIGLAALPPSLATVGKNSGPGGAPRNVVVLHLGYNQIATKTLLEAAVKDFPRLTDLTIAGNPAAMLDDVIEWAGKLAKSALTGLTTLDQKPVAAISMAAATKHLNREQDGAMGVEDGASCSCVEGNPCISPYNCKNWEKRFEIAKQARRR